MTTDEAMGICIREGIIVYPVNEGKKMYIEYSENGVTTRFPKIIKAGKGASEALEKTYIYLAKKINAEKSSKLSKKN